MPLARPTFSGQILTNGSSYTALPNVYAAPITDFRLDTLSISSYTDDGFGDSILAHGVVDNFVVTVPPPPVQNLTNTSSNGVWQAQFLSRSNWVYTLERTTDFQSWTNVSPVICRQRNESVPARPPSADRQGILPRLR